MIFLNKSKSPISAASDGRYRERGTVPRGTAQRSLALALPRTNASRFSALDRRSPLGAERLEPDDDDAHRVSFASPGVVPGVFTSGQKASLLLVSLAVGVSAGIFEELGWTGFAIPTLRRRHGVLVIGLIVGIWWSAWHLLPNLWSSRAAAGDLPMSLHLAGIAVGVFVGYLTAFRILMVWVYEHTESMLIGMLMHMSFSQSAGA